MKQINKYRTGTMLVLFLLVALVPKPVVAALFEPGVGGSVGMGEVQAAFRWNAGATQSKINGVTFFYESTDTYAVICTWQKADGVRIEKRHTLAIDTRTEVVSHLRVEPGQDGYQFITGFELAGFKGSGVASGKAPQMGEPCPVQEKPKGTVTKVELVDALDRLFITYGGQKIPIWTAPK